MFAKVNWKTCLKRELKELKGLMDTGALSLASILSWSEQAPDSVRINIPTLGYLSHSSQLAFLTRCSKRLEVNDQDCYDYQDTLLIQVQRLLKRQRLDQEQLLEWGKKETGFLENCTVEGMESLDGRRNFVLALVARRLTLSTNLETAYIGNFLCTAFRHAIVPFKNAVRVGVLLPKLPIEQSHKLLDNGQASDWVRE
jgi:hypothetical protein